MYVYQIKVQNVSKYIIIKLKKSSHHFSVAKITHIGHRAFY